MIENKKDFEQFDQDMFQRVEMNEQLGERIAGKSLNFWQDAWLRLKKNKAAIFSLSIILILVLLALFGPMLSARDAYEQNISQAKLPPKVTGLEWAGFDGMANLGGRDINFYEQKNVEENFWFGTDYLGRDLWSRVWEGTRISLFIGLMAAIIDTVIGVAYGGVSAYFGGRIDNIMQRIVEILTGVPNLILIILFILIFDPGVFTIILAMAITGWIGMSRLVRGQILKLKNQEFVLAARTLGASSNRLIFKHLIPNTLGAIIITLMFTIPSAIFFEAFLSFIGIGLQPPQASLGTLINDGYKELRTFPYLLVIPSIIIVLLMVSFNLLADGLRDAFDPKMRK
ncbi:MULTISPECIES: oligopeptide ABC transporter permease [Exiguobacterium]|uniref:oligopeptide ABC transporter permease n=2 Tax=Bacillales Family XII. Incertae Sedis TaxID=539742 RepID=UPI000877665F|nr:ABC transporter permease [Exiguobacterium sp. SH4S7]TCI45842.1 ABC transporter permease [Exiguobacterium sp. SH5S32]TCI51598.1 ABC transporter permease [Exiguobacterium sp. SH1S4]TCI53639.1 ABC transporter permease [Exiguobacterium sp. SH1S21]TCI65615.1 ABC transporter permease [Exiguobacterium sp. SH0S2]TCI71585.1 ABC transporter permease [Exiguobacterium sp. SH1S1]TCI79966.1 ABC transporter permease [Exiguobacterium sp. SH0S1]